MKKIICALLFLISINTNANFNPYTAVYSITWHGVNVGNAHHELKHTNDDNFYFLTQTKPRFAIVPYSNLESSLFKIDNKTIKPIKYSFKHKEPTEHNSGWFEFDWQNKTLSILSDGKNTNTKFADNTYDPLSYLLQLRLDLINSDKKSFDYTVIKPDKIKIYNFRIVGEEMVPTPFANIKCVKVSNINDDRRTTIYFAPEYDYLMIKLVQAKSGKEVIKAQLVNFAGNIK